jgi:hypothetical protein
VLPRFAAGAPPLHPLATISAATVTIDAAPCNAFISLFHRPDLARRRIRREGKIIATEAASFRSAPRLAFRRRRGMRSPASVQSCHFL